MALNSMTGFGRADGSLDAVLWFWEIRSVNGRGLDVRTRLPAGYESLDPMVRGIISKSLQRGNVSVNLNLRREAANGELQLNEAALDRVLAAANKVQQKLGNSAEAALRTDVVLGLRGVLETVDHELSEEQENKVRKAIMASLDDALSQLVDARGEEGRRLHDVVAAQIDEITQLVDTIEAAPARTIEAIQTRLKTQVEKLLETGQDLDPGRLHQEAILLATRADIEEELKRLKAHLEAAKDLLSNNGAVGRKLDFLAQEFNREANTICSKSNDATITQAGLALKVVIDQMREQVQNIE